MVYWCPKCNSAYTYQDNTGDYIHSCDSGDDNLDKESVRVIGTWEDSDGTSGTTTTSEAIRAGMANKYMGDRTSKSDPGKEYNIFGDDIATHRLRAKGQFIEKPEVTK